MKLDVLQPTEIDAPWYAAGLAFTCQQCGNCCTGGPGYVWISDQEIERLAALLRLSRQQVLERFCRPIGDRVSLKETRNTAGQYDCVFLQDVKHKDGTVKRVCSVYEARPLQCRTWPFWDGVLASRQNWERAGERCHGINQGSRRFARQQIEALRDAIEWPDDPPTSKAAAVTAAPKSR
jgi:Fe-S-cluster containining protein